MKRALLIGYGSIGRRHTEILVHRLNFQVDIVTKQNVEGHQCFKDLSDVADIENYDYYLITSPTNLHYDQLKFLNGKLDNKIIFIEKPLFDVPYYLDLKNSVFIGYDLRYSFVLNELKKNIDSESVLFIQAYVGQYLPTWRKNIDYRSSYSASKKRGGGVLLDLSHELDYIQFLCGKITDIKSYNDKISNLEIDSDDIFTAVGKTVSGTVVNVTMDYISKQTMRYCIVHLQNRTLYADFIRNFVKVTEIDGMTYTVHCETEPDNYSYYTIHSEILDPNISEKKVCSYDEALSIVNLIKKTRKE